jgi:hypothetical protein
VPLVRVTVQVSSGRTPEVEPAMFWSQSEEALNVPLVPEGSMTKMPLTGPKRETVFLPTNERSQLVGPHGRIASVFTIGEQELGKVSRLVCFSLVHCPSDASRFQPKTSLGRPPRRILLR